MKKKFIFMLACALIFSINVQAVTIEEPETLFDKPSEIYIFKKGSVDVYAGPSKDKEKLDFTIPSNEIIKELAINLTEKSYWAYIEYNGKKGWIDACPRREICGDSYVAEKATTNGNDLTLSNSVKLYSFPEQKDEYFIQDSPISDDIKVLYRYQMFPTWLYVEIGNVKGWVLDNENAFIETTTFNVVLLNDSYLYETAGGNKTDIIYKKGTKVTAKAIHRIYEDNNILNEYIKVTHDNKDMWLLITSDKVKSARQAFDSDFDSIISNLGDEAIIYEDYANNKKQVGVYKLNDKVNELYEYIDDNGDRIVYIVTDNYEGWTTNKFYNYVEEKTPTKGDVIEETKDDEGNLLIRLLIALPIILVIIVVVVFISKKKKTNNKEINTEMNQENITNDTNNNN